MLFHYKHFLHFKQLLLAVSGLKESNIRDLDGWYKPKEPFCKTDGKIKIEKYKYWTDWLQNICAHFAIAHQPIAKWSFVLDLREKSLRKVFSLSKNLLTATFEPFRTCFLEDLKILPEKLGYHKEVLFTFYVFIFS